VNLARELARHKAVWASMVPSAVVSRHPYGFLVIKLDATIRGGQVRFNVWLKRDRSGQDPSWPIHSHEIAMTSRVIRGSLRNIVWPEPRFGFGEPLYLVSYGPTSSTLQKSDVRISAGRKNSETVAQGTQYEVAKGVFHATEVPNNRECVTLCIFHAEEVGIGTVLGREGYAERIEFQRFEVTPTTADAARKLVVKALS
jgi:hypothetical protein